MQKIVFSTVVLSWRDLKYLLCVGEGGIHSDK